MNELWSDLVPLILAGLLVPSHLVLTILFLRSSAGKRTAVAFVAGLTTIRLAQGLIFGPVVATGDLGQRVRGPSPVVSSVLLILGLLLYVTALRELLFDEDPDAPPPKWRAMIETAGPGKGFLLGAGLLLISGKFWVFTLGALVAIGDAGLDRAESIVTYLIFVVLTQSLLLLVVGMAFALPRQSTLLLDSASGWLTRNNGAIVIILGVVFGTWFVLKGLQGLGVL